jgi:hypothetical protein
MFPEAEFLPHWLGAWGKSKIATPHSFMTDSVSRRQIRRIGRAAKFVARAAARLKALNGECCDSNVLPAPSCDTDIAVGTRGLDNLVRNPAGLSQGRLPLRR